MYLQSGEKINRPFPSCFEPHYESEAKCKVFVMKISFHSYANKTNFHLRSFALSLAFIVRFTATRKWPILYPPYSAGKIMVLRQMFRLRTRQAMGERDGLN